LLVYATAVYWQTFAQHASVLNGSIPISVLRSLTLDGVPIRPLVQPAAYLLGAAPS